MNYFSRGLILLLTLCAFSCGTATAQKALLWRIKGKGLTRPSYLFGTAHLICPGDYMWTTVMKDAFNQSAEICLEMNISDQAELARYQTGLTDPGGKTLDQYFSPQQYTELSRYFKDTLHMDLSLLQQLKPVVLAGFIELKTLDCTAPVSYEYNLIAEANKTGKTLSGLENATETIQIVNHIPADSLVKGVMDMVHGDTKGKEYMRIMLRAYLQQDIDTMARMARSQLPGLSTPLLDERNQNWIPKMTAKMLQHSVFFAVGAGHLAGEQGVIALLKKAGYQVEAVK